MERILHAISHKDLHHVENKTRRKRLIKGVSKMGVATQPLLTSSNLQEQNPPAVEDFSGLSAIGASTRDRLIESIRRNVMAWTKWNGRDSYIVGRRHNRRIRRFYYSNGGKING